MAEELKGLDWLFDEIARRRLMHAAGVYTVVCWFVVQLLATAAPYVGLPEWVVQVAIALPFAGLPVVLGIAWLVGTPEPDAPRADAPSAGAPPGPGTGPATRPPAPSAQGTGKPPAPARAASPPVGLPLSEVALLLALAFLGGALWVYRSFGVNAGRAGAAGVEAPGAPPTALAVLPFENLGGDPEEEYFSHGITEEIRSALSRIPGLKVASRTSSFVYAGSDRSLRQVAGELGVGSVLEGSVRRSEDRIRVAVRLVDARSDAQLWAETFDRELDVESLFAIESDIARSVAGALEVELGVAPEAHAALAPVSLEAHDLYLLGLYHWNRRTGEELGRAAGFFRAAADREPGYALAHAGLANTWLLLPLYGGVPSHRAMPEARASAERALALDSTLAEARAAIAFVQTAYDWEWQAAEASFRRALAADPSYATAWEWYGVLLDALGRFDEAGVAHERALALDPLSLIINAVSGLHHVLAGDNELAIVRLRRTLELRDDFPLGLMFLAEAQFLAGRHGEAEETLLRWAKATGTPEEPWAAVVRGARDPAARGEAVAALAVLAEDDALSSYRLAQFHAFVGADEEALDALETAFLERDFLLYLVNVDPAFAGLRREPRYVRLMEAMGLRR